ncbi:MAG: hypothetical protein AAFY25_13775 [Pseudomonadota bacterium]
MLWVILVAVAFVIPFWKLLPQFGLSPYWAIAAVFPLFALALLYVMAFLAGPRKG